MPSLGPQIAALQASMVKITVKRTGRVRAPKLDDPQLTAIGQQMVAAQKARWLQSVDADGQTAKKLSVRYAIIKQAVLHVRPKRDMVMTGATMKNFQLRKATNGVIRAENTTRLERAKALRANGYDQMIGLAVSDMKAIMDESKAQYGAWVNTAWIPLGGSSAINGGGQAVPMPSTYSTGTAANTRFAAAGGRTRRPSVMRRKSP